VQISDLSSRLRRGMPKIEDFLALCTKSKILSHRLLDLPGLFEKFLNIQAFVRSKGEKIHVTYYRYPPELVPLFQGLNEKLRSRGISPRVPWLNNKNLEFHFK